MFDMLCTVKRYAWNGFKQINNKGKVALWENYIITARFLQYDCLNIGQNGLKRRAVSTLFIMSKTDWEFLDISCKGYSNEHRLKESCAVLSRGNASLHLRDSSMRDQTNSHLLSHLVNQPVHQLANTQSSTYPARWSFHFPSHTHILYSPNFPTPTVSRESCRHQTSFLPLTSIHGALHCLQQAQV